MGWFDARLRSSIPGGATFHLMGVFVGGVGLVLTLTRANLRATDVAEAVLLLALSLPFFEGGRRIAHGSLSFSRRMSVAKATVAFGFFGFGITAVTVILRTLAGNPVGEESYILLLVATGTGAVGLYTGLYHQRLQASSSETTRLNHRLQVTQRVLRHNLRNEVMVLRGYVDAIEPSVSGPGEEYLSVLGDHVDRLARLSEKAHQLEAVWRSDERVVRDLVAVVDDATDRLDVDGLAGTSFVTTRPTTAYAHVHPRIDEAVDEALDNALRHNDTDGLTVYLTVTAREEEVLLTVADDGVGLPHSELDAIQSGTETQLRHASGLGLWLIYWVAVGSGGRFDLTDHDPSGTVVTLRFEPAAPPEARE